MMKIINSLTLTCIYIISVATVCSSATFRLLNCGGATTSSDAYNRPFFPDIGYLAATTTSSSHSASIAQSEADRSSSSSIPSLYHTARVFTRPTRYSFPVRHPQFYLVRFHFYPFQIDNPIVHEAEFHAVANEFILFRNLRPPRLKEDGKFPLIREFIIPVSSDQLDITFLPSEKSNFGFINAIEVIDAPSDLIADVAYHYSNKSEIVSDLLSNGFETVHRVNVGGFKITPFNDSLSRTWVTDDDEERYYVSNSDKPEKVHFGGRIRYRNGGASREVGPDNMYNSARVVKTNTNLTWTFEVEKGYKHLVRMHFCDVASIAINMLYFNVYINDKLAYENLDISEATSWLLASPFYADFIVDGSDDKLVVSVGPSKMSVEGGVQGILNGVEVWKINNSMRSFDGEVCEELLWKVWRRERIGLLIPFMVVIVLLLMGSLMMQRRTRGGVPVAWSRLPVDVFETEFKSGNMLSSVKV